MAKYALLTGINHYEVPGNDLGGCVNDVKHVYFILRMNFGFKNEDIRVLSDHRATNDAELSRLRWLASNAKAGDLVVWYHSGHGSQIRDRSGDELDDKLDEILIPFNIDRNWKNVIKDDELHEIMKSFHPDVKVVCIVDACHSGTMTKDFIMGGTARRDKYMPPPFDLQARWFDEMAEPRKDIPAKRLGAPGKVTPLADSAPVEIKIVSDPNQNHILISGCQDWQTSQESTFKGMPRGVLTYNLFGVLEAKAVTDEDTTWMEVHEELCQRVGKMGFSQVPRLSGSPELLNSKPFNGFVRSSS